MRHRKEFLSGRTRMLSPWLSWKMPAWKLLSHGYESSDVSSVPPLQKYRIHSNRRSCLNTSPPLSIITLLAGVSIIFVSKMHGFEARFWAHHYAPTSCLVRAQCLLLLDQKEYGIVHHMTSVITVKNIFKTKIKFTLQLTTTADCRRRIDKMANQVFRDK